MKIVINTNIVLSALFSNKGASHKLLVWLFENKKKYNVVSNILVTEFEDVLAFIDDICLISYHQSIHFLWRPFLKDSNDDMVLEVAVNANVGAIVTFNPKDFQGVKKSFGIELLKGDVSINQFIINAVAEKLATLKTLNHLEKRALRGSRKHALDLLSVSPNIEPKEHDRL